MNKIAKTLLATSLATGLTFGGFGLVHADSDRYERGEHMGMHEGMHGGHHGKFCDKHGNKGQRLERMIEHLGLSDEQATQVRAIRDKYMPKKQALRSKIKATRKELREVMHAETIDQAKVEKLAKAMGELKAEKIMLRGQMRSEIHKVLTKEQLQKMQAFKAQRGFRHMHGE